MAGRGLAMHVFSSCRRDIDVRHDAGHDAERTPRPTDVRVVRAHPNLSFMTTIGTISVSVTALEPISGQSSMASP